MVISPDLDILHFKEIKGVKYFELTAEEIKQEILPGVFIKAWGYNGTTPGPTILVYPGDYVNIRVYNKLSVPTTIHWHGLDVPNTMDGVPDVAPSPRIEPGGFFDYRFQIINPPGTHMYHTHDMSNMQQMMGLQGGLIILNPYGDNIDRDYFIMVQEFKLKDIPQKVVNHGEYMIDPMAHEFNFFTINGKCFPFATPLDVIYGERVRVRLANAMMDAHPMHLHGHQFDITAADGNPIPKHNIVKKNTINVASGETWEVEFNANNPGIWPFHCHIPHHMTNNMSESTGGMFTTVIYKA